MYYADGIGFKDDLVLFRKSMIANVEAQNNLEIRLHTPVTAELIQAEHPDVLIAACGAIPAIPPIPGIDHPKVHHVTDLFHKNLVPGKQIVIIGGGQAGCEEALSLADSGHHVTIVEMKPELAREAYFIHWKHMLQKIKEHPNIQVLCNTQVCRIDDQGVTVIPQASQQQVLPADTVLVAAGMKANNAMVAQWEPLVPELRIVGDCASAARIMDATRSGYCAGHTI